MLRRAGIEGLGIFGPDAVAHAPIIVAALSDSDPDVRAAAPSSSAPCSGGTSLKKNSAPPFAGQLSSQAVLADRQAGSRDMS